MYVHMLFEAIHFRSHVLASGLPVECIKHFDDDQHREGHGHRMWVSEDGAVDCREHARLRWALHVVSLWKE